MTRHSRRALPYEIKQGFMAFLAVDKDGTEKIFGSVPYRRNWVQSVAFDIVTARTVRRAYTKNQFNKWSAHWSSDSDDPLPEGCIVLPKGSIEKLIGRKLTWKDNYVEL